ANAPASLPPHDNGLPGTELHPVLSSWCLALAPVGKPLALLLAPAGIARATPREAKSHQDYDPVSARAAPDKREQAQAIAVAAVRTDSYRFVALAALLGGRVASRKVREPFGGLLP